jgi:Domain of unknown function (DUF4279)
MLLAVQLFVQGDRLQPVAITELLGIEPHTAHALGDTWTSPAGKAHVKKVGLWKWGVSEDAESANLNSLVLYFCEKLNHVASDLPRLPGAERTWIDVFVCREQQDTSTEIEFSLSPAAVRALCAFDLPIEFTTDVLVRDATESPNP